MLLKEKIPSMFIISLLIEENKATQDILVKVGSIIEVKSQKSSFGHEKDLEKFFNGSIDRRKFG